MNKPQQALVLSTCEIMSAYPHLSVEDALGDARQIERWVRKQGLGDPEAEALLLTAACRLLAADSELVPASAVERAVRIYEAVREAG